MMFPFPFSSHPLIPPASFLSVLFELTQIYTHTSLPKVNCASGMWRESWQVKCQDGKWVIKLYNKSYLPQASSQTTHKHFSFREGHSSERNCTKLSTVTLRHRPFINTSPSCPLEVWKHFGAFCPGDNMPTADEWHSNKPWRPVLKQPSTPAVGRHPGRSPECQSFIRAPACVPPANSCAPLLLRLHIACDLMAAFGWRHRGKREREGALCLYTGSAALKIYQGLSMVQKQWGECGLGWWVGGVVGVWGFSSGWEEQVDDGRICWRGLVCDGRMEICWFEPSTL